MFEYISPKRLPYSAQLYTIREVLENQFQVFLADRKFPDRCCIETTRLVSTVLGLEQVAGEYTPHRTTHAWNYDPDRGLFIDLTQDQFPSPFWNRIPKIAVLPIDTRRLKLTRANVVRQHAIRLPEVTRFVRSLNADVLARLRIQ